LLSDFDTSINNAVLLPFEDPQSPTGSTLTLLLAGGNPNLEPEEATTWSAGFDWRPMKSQNSKISLTYFDIDYEKRIGSVPSTALGSIVESATLYAPAIRLDPAPAELQSYIDGYNFIDFYGQPFTLDDIAALADFRTINLAVQRVKGIDFDIEHVQDLNGSSLTAGVNLSYLLENEVAASPAAPAISIVDTAFNPLRFSARGHLGWQQRAYACDLFLNYLPSYVNTIQTPSEPVGSWTTVDLNFRIDFASLFASNLFEGMQLSLSATNIFDRAPPFVTAPPSRPAINYDPTNASPLGRFIAVRVQKKW
jgi:iron complex outermembrane recepter protein